VQYVDQRYQRTLSHEKLASFLPRFWIILRGHLHVHATRL
jgi:hypothetical protein